MTVIVSPPVYPAPALEILTALTVPAVATTDPVAVIPVPVGPENVTDGVVLYPAPPLVTVTIPILPVVAIPTVTATPTPPPPTKTTSGGERYPAPGFVIRISLIDLDVVIPVLLVVIATAVASMPPDGAEEIATVGVLVYPLPSLRRLMN